MFDGFSEIKSEGFSEFGLFNIPAQKLGEDEFVVYLTYYN